MGDLDALVGPVVSAPSAGLRIARAPALVRAIAPTATAAVLGNAFVGRDGLDWFRGLRHPRMQIPLTASFAVGALFYLCIGTVLQRSAIRGDKRAYRLALIVLAGNELWNIVFFGRRSTRDGFFGMLVFTVPVCVLQASVADDRTSTIALGPYTAWVIGYDIPWTYQLWRLNR